MPPVSADLFQWILNQGIAVAILVLAIVLLGPRLDRANVNLEQLTIAVNTLTAMVAAHMPPAR